MEQEKREGFSRSSLLSSSKEPSPCHVYLTKLGVITTWRGISIIDYLPRPQSVEYYVDEEGSVNLIRLKRSSKGTEKYPLLLHALLIALKQA